MAGGKVDGDAGGADVVAQVGVGVGVGDEGECVGQRGDEGHVEVREQHTVSQPMLEEQTHHYEAGAVQGGLEEAAAAGLAEQHVEHIEAEGGL